MAGKRSEGSTGRFVTPERWQRIIRLMDETFEDYLTGMATLRERVVMDLGRKLSDSKVLNARRGGQPLPEERPASAARHARRRGSRHRRS